MRAPLLLVLSASAGAAALASCHGAHDTMTTHPTLILDTSFTAAEMAQVTAAIDAWESLGPDVRFAVVMEDHDAIGRKAAQSPDDDTIYFQRAIGGSCMADLDGFAGMTKWNPNGSTISCVNADLLDAESDVRPNGLEGATAHELGHSLGLAHDDVGVAEGKPESVMTTWHQNGPRDGRPTCIDSQRVAAHFGVARSPACP